MTQARYSGSDPRRPTYQEAKNWPTPQASEGDPKRGLAMVRGANAQGGQNGNGMGTPLGIAVKQWPTPTSRDWKDGADPSPNAPTNGLLGRAVPRDPTTRAWATPRSCSAAAAAAVITPEAMAKAADRFPNLETQAALADPGATGMALSAAWVEMLQGFPQNWTLIDGPLLPAKRKATTSPRARRKAKLTEPIG